jgi:LPS-assembly protein
MLLMRFRLVPTALFALCAFISAAYGEEEPLKLKLDRTFRVMPHAPNATPAFITAAHMEGEKGGQLEATGNAELHSDGRAIFADRMLYQQDAQKVYADGSVRIEQQGSIVSGPHLEFNLSDGTGEMTQPTFHLAENNSRGNADSLSIESKQKFTLYHTTYTTCPDGNDDWLLKIGELDIDRSTQIGVAHNTVAEFKGVPIMYSPWMDFALNGGRKTGFLGPVFGNTTTGGSEITVPVYWNIAPNYDATIAPRIMAKRGTLLTDEFRYLEPDYYGQIKLDAISQDRMTQSTRSHESLMHNQNLGDGFSYALNVNHVSDDAYFRDLSTSISDTSQAYLLRSGTLNYNGGWWNASTSVQSFQTLQDPLAPLPIPYNLTPQVAVSAQQTLDSGTNALFTGQYVNFSHPTAINAQRLVLYPSASYPLVSDPAYYVTPKIGYHYTYYDFGMNNTTALPNTARALPIASVDSGMTFERETAFNGNDYVQTLEPRAYYLYVPYRNQDAIPVFDTAQPDFSFAQMFSENRFLGSDRIGDANQITLAATSRLFNVSSGIEQFQVTLGERFSFITPKVNLVAPTDTTNKSDILVGFSGRTVNTLSVDGFWDYNPSQARTEMYSAWLHFIPESGKVFNLGYLYTRDTLQQVDLSEQWLLAGRWHTVARWNYSLQGKRLLEGLAGLEYNQTCWAVRLVAQRFATATQQYSTGFFIQLDLNGLAGIGSDPVDTLRRSIPGYTKSNQDIPSETSQGLQ